MPVAAAARTVGAGGIVQSTSLEVQVKFRLGAAIQVCLSYYYVTLTVACQ